MRSYIIRRVLSLFPILFLVATIVFFIHHIVPGDPVDLIIGEQALPADRARLAEDLGLNEPVLVQYKDYLGKLASGDMGISLYDGMSVAGHLRERSGATLLLACAAMFISIIIAIPAGIFAAVKKDSVWDSAAMLAALIGISVPNFWLGPVLILVFSVHLGILPISGIDSWTSLILPSVTLGAALAAMLSRMTRASMIGELKADYVTTAKAKGLSPRKVVLKHALKNALNPIVTIIGLQVATLLAGTIITEKIFGWPGIGTLLLDSIGRRDYPVVQGAVLFISFAYVVINTTVDCVYKAFDPRIRL